MSGFDLAHPLIHTHPPAVRLRELQLSAIDFESAGAAPGRTDVPVQIGLARWSLTHGIHDPFSSYLQSSQPITWSARKVHGIQDSDLEGAPSLLDLWPTLESYLRRNPVVAHGQGTEKRFLRTFPGHGFHPWLDTLLLSRAAWPHLPSHSLSHLCEHFQLTPALMILLPGKRWHDALFDAAASLAVLQHLITTFQLEDHSVDALVSPPQHLWHRHRLE